MSRGFLNPATTVWRAGTPRVSNFTFNFNWGKLKPILGWNLGINPQKIFALGRRSAMFARLLLLLAVAAPVFAQQTTATLLGTVTDPSGAGVPGVAIQAASLATNVTRETQTDGSGAYSLPNLPPGPY